MSEGKEKVSPEALAEEELKQLETDRDELLEKHSNWLGADTVKALKFAPSHEVIQTMKEFLKNKGWEQKASAMAANISASSADQSPEISEPRHFDRDEFKALLALPTKLKEIGEKKAKEFVPQFIEIESKILELEAERQDPGVASEIAEAA